MKNKSLISLIVCYCIMIYAAFFFYPKWEQERTEATISWDVSGYYLYLPTFLIYNDAKEIKFFDSIIHKYYPSPDFQQAFKHEGSGNLVMKYSSGQAIVMLPWFLVADTWAKNSDIYPRDGYSYPYQICLGIGMFIYALIALWLLRKILLKYFSDHSVAISLLLLVIGTNYINYSSVDQCMTHNTLFLIYCVLIWQTIQFYKQPKTWRIVLLGLLCGLASLIRPTEMISVLVPLLWGVSNKKDLVERIGFLKTNGRYIALFAFSMIAVGSIQLFYWKYITGDWIVYSYQDQGFSWLSPHVSDYLFSYRCGWLRYCPMMYLPIIGLLFYFKNGSNKLAIYAMCLVSFYVVTAWDVWDYGSTAGRAMVQYYPFLMFPFTNLVQQASKQLWSKVLLLVFGIVFAYLNIWWFYNAHSDNIRVAEVSRAYYLKTVGRWSTDKEDLKLIDNKYSYRGNLLNEKIIYTNNFTLDTSQNKVVIDGDEKIMVSQQHPYSSKYQFFNPKDGNQSYRVYATYTTTFKEWDTWKQTQAIIKFYDGDKEVGDAMLRLYRILNDNETREVFFDADCKKEWSRAEIFFWNIDSDKSLLIDDLKVVSYTKE